MLVVAQHGPILDVLTGLELMLAGTRPETGALVKVGNERLDHIRQDKRKKSSVFPIIPRRLLVFSGG